MQTLRVEVAAYATDEWAKMRKRKSVLETNLENDQYDYRKMTRKQLKKELPDLEHHTKEVEMAIDNMVHL